ncbi:hypothetical protein SBA3_260030 [Candidatus Sulfopaludibacter sp. SbA3]|nr:hypothetical protein SBA3_260030 [Candidatus Sulfopaludibacter sp. SbA3]
MESVQEFHIQSLLTPAEFPQNGGAAIDVVTKSGSKSLHGSGFEYFDNEATDARNYFDDPTLPRPIFRQSEFGASLGGPVPVLKNTFFYGVYEGLRQKTGNSKVSLVPDAPTRAGDFTGSGFHRQRQRHLRSAQSECGGGHAHAFPRRPYSAGAHRPHRHRVSGQVPAPAQQQQRSRQLSGRHAQPQQ